MTIERRIAVGKRVIPFIKNEAKIGDKLFFRHTQHAKTEPVSDLLVFTAEEEVLSPHAIQVVSKLQQFVGYAIPIGRGSGLKVLTGNEINDRTHIVPSDRRIRPVFRYKEDK